MGRRDANMGGYTLPNELFVTSLIKSVQYGVITINNTETTQTATITAVTLARASLVFLGSLNTSPGFANSQIRLELTDATTVTAFRGPASIVSTVRFCVVEYQPLVIKRVQRGAINIAAGNTSNTAAITSVNTAKSILSWLGQTSAMGDATEGSAHLTLTSATVVTATRSASTNDADVNYQVLEFY